MAEDNKKLLQAAKKNLDALGNALGKKIGAAIENQDAVDVTSNLTAVKKSFAKPVGTLTSIPDEVYRKIAEALNANSKIKSIFTEYSTNEGKLIKQVATQVGKLLSKIDDIKVPVEENGKTVNYTVKFAGSHLGVSGSFINVLKGNKNSWLNWKDENTGKTAMSQYCVSLYNLSKKVTDAKKIILNTLIENGAKILNAVFNDGTESVYKTVFGNAAFKKVAKEYTLFEIGKVVQSVKNKKISTALTQYEQLNNIYNNLVTEINSKTSTAANVKIWANSFTDIAKKIQSTLSSFGVTVNLETLPTPALGLVYNANSTSVTLPANCTSELKTSDYKSSVKNIYADTFTKAVTINGNAKDNVIYGGSGNDKLNGNDGKDTLYGGAGKDNLSGGKGKDKLFGEAGNDTLVGGKGDDTLTGGAGKDTFYYANGDGKDVIADFTAQDKIYLTSGSIDKVTLSGKDVTFKIGNGSIKLQNAKNKEITIVDTANDTTKKYLNNKLVSESKDGTFWFSTDGKETTLTVNENVYTVINDYGGIYIKEDGVVTGLDEDAELYIKGSGEVTVNGKHYNMDVIYNQKIVGFKTKGGQLSSYIYENAGTLDSIMDFEPKSSVALFANDIDNPNKLLDNVTFAQTTDEK